MSNHHLQTDQTGVLIFLRRIATLGRTGVLVGLSLVIFGCADRSKVSERRTFPAVAVPVLYSTQQAQAEFLTLHFWDQFDFKDTTWVGSAEKVTEQALINYLSILRYAPYPVICKGIQQLLDRADQNQAMYAFFYSRMEYHLANPKSMLRNDEFYIPVLEHMITSNSLDDPRKARVKTILPLLNKNRPGTQASNIHFTSVTGVKNALTNIKSDYILVVFYDFDCEDCSILKRSIEKSEIVLSLQKQKKLAILAIYPGSNMEGWKKSSPQIPASWINGYDHNDEIGRDGTYILRSIPTLFLLNRDYMVIMKEPPFDYVESYLKSVLAL
ncbi:MAG: DUF5106 domain-containing protein [Tannerella sp.]|jgi:hypothetical protein|nr:DUF5106 domain-containing protein [Tannerella sp.]